LWLRSGVRLLSRRAEAPGPPQLAVPVGDQLPVWFSFSPPDPPMGGTGRLFGFWSEPLSPQLVVADWGPSSLLSGYGPALPAYREPC